MTRSLFSIKFSTLTTLAILLYIIIFIIIVLLMGNNDSKKRQDSDEKHLVELFQSISHGKSTINREELKAAWAAKIDPQLYFTFEKYLLPPDSDVINYSDFKKLYYEIYKGDLDERSEALKKLLVSGDAVPHSELLQFLSRVLRNILIIEHAKGSKPYKSWTSRCKTSDLDSTLKRNGEYYLRQIDSNTKASYDEKDLKVLIGHFGLFLNIIIGYLYEKTDESSFNFFPKWKYIQIDSGKKLEQFSILNLVHIIFLNSELPTDYQNEWNVLFSTSVHGESFSRLSGQIINKGPTIILVKDKKGHIFGGFAPHSWSYSPNFVGDSSSFLFTLYPNMNIYPASNFNENYQYMNIGQQTMPNGLGMGGRLEYFGLWLDAEFGKGNCSEVCTTYRQYKMMSATKNFDIAHVEVWAVGPPPPSAAELGERSVLDSDLEAKAILEMAGKKTYSDGLRDVPDE